MTTQLRHFNNFIANDDGPPRMIRILHVDADYIIYQVAGDIFQYHLNNHTVERGNFEVLYGSGACEKVFALNNDGVIISIIMCNTYCILFTSTQRLICCDTTRIPWNHIPLHDHDNNEYMDCI